MHGGIHFDNIVIGLDEAASKNFAEKVKRFLVHFPFLLSPYSCLCLLLSNLSLQTWRVKHTAQVEEQERIAKLVAETRRKKVWPWFLVVMCFGLTSA